MEHFIGNVNKNQNMTDEMEKMIEIYYEDSIELPENHLLTVKRISNHRYTDRQAIRVSLEDLENEKVVDLGLYFDARWSFSSPMNEKVFWQQVKENSQVFTEIFNRLRSSVPGREALAYRVKAKSISTSISQNIQKLTKIFRDGTNNDSL